MWEGWEAGFMAFHAFHTLSFPWFAFRPARQDRPRSHLAQCAAPATKCLSLSVVNERIGDFALNEIRLRCRQQAVAFEIICRSVSELFVVKSLHARAEWNVGSSSRCCDGSVSGDPAISGTKEISGDGRGRRGRLLSYRSKMGKSVSEAWTGSPCTQIKRRPRLEKGGLTADQGRD
jgi:hypothetical protein